jgi:hypothetical protein
MQVFLHGEKRVKGRLGMGMASCDELGDDEGQRPTVRSRSLCPLCLPIHRLADQVGRLRPGGSKQTTLFDPCLSRPAGRAMNF